jgi:hypothetical protein
LSSDAAGLAFDRESPSFEAELCSFCATTAEMSLTVASTPGANVLSLDAAFADLSVSTALSPVSMTFSLLISVATSVESLVARGAVPKAEGTLRFDDAAPSDEDEFVEEAFVLEEPLDGKLEVPAESRALAPTLVSVTLYVLTEVLSFGATWAPPAALPATAPRTEPKSNAVQIATSRCLIKLLFRRRLES